MTVTDYKSSFYEVSNLDEAMKKILTPVSDVSPSQRWETETPVITEMLTQHLNPRVNESILDYGCGIGRLAKELILRTGCHVIGVDISRSMRALSQIYCESDSFFSCSKKTLKALTDQGFHANQAFSVWVLQHAENPKEDIDLIYDALESGGNFFVTNLELRCLPTSTGWENDGINIKELIENRFEVVDYFPTPQDAAPKLDRLISFCALYRKPAK